MLNLLQFQHVSSKRLFGDEWVLNYRDNKSRAKSNIFHRSFHQSKKLSTAEKLHLIA